MDYPKNTITDNLIIKGNNLLALHSLKKEFVGKIKLIYIDPPYNTGNDSFKYNDNFNHSTWLTFIKNRISLAYSLLMDDGVIFINIDDKELFYLKPLMDEVFSPENYIITNSIKRSGATGHKAINPTPISATDLLIIYAKDKRKWKYHPQYIKRDYDSNYDKYIPNIGDSYSKWEIKPISALMKEVDIRQMEQLAIEHGEKIIRLAETGLR